ncbi:MAG: hypothetical protein J5651_08480 [Salinivirgaceae bacterium]|nr:hypothetical protein [Salinivirgaceae bacterium]
MSQEMENTIEQFKSLKISSVISQWTMIRSYARTLPDSELLEYYSSQKNKPDLIKSVLQKRDLKRLAAGQHKTIGKLLDEFVKRKRGYSHLRLALVRRYDFASKADRRRIVEALLSEYRQDRILAYQMLKLNWDSYFTDKLVSLYNQYHDKECLIVFIKHYPRTILQDKFDALVEQFDYPYACYCMGADFSGKIDKYKMQPNEWLRLMATFKQKVSETEAETILYYTFAMGLLDDLSYRETWSTELVSVKALDVIRDLGRLGYADSIVRFGKILEQTQALIQPGAIIYNVDKYSFPNKLYQILPNIEVEDGYHSEVKKWAETVNAIDSNNYNNAKLLIDSFPDEKNDDDDLPF